MPTREDYLSFCRDSSSLAGAAFIAREWHTGQFSPLYMLSCFAYDHWTVGDLDDMIADFERLEAEGIDISDELAALVHAHTLLSAAR